VLPFSFADESVLKSDPQRETLTRLIDFDLLGGMIPLIVTAVDIETGEEVAFDSQRVSLTLDHIMASTAFRSLFHRSPLATVNSSIRGSLRTSLC
jgi:NTE family protein